MHGWQQGKAGGLCFHCYLLQKLNFVSTRLKLHIFYPQVIPRENACIIYIVYNFEECTCEGQPKFQPLSSSCDSLTGLISHLSVPVIQEADRLAKNILLLVPQIVF